MKKRGAHCTNSETNHKTPWLSSSANTMTHDSSTSRVDNSRMHDLTTTA